MCDLKCSTSTRPPPFSASLPSQACLLSLPDLLLGSRGQRTNIRLALRASRSLEPAFPVRLGKISNSGERNMVNPLVQSARSMQLEANMMSHKGDIMYIESFGKGILVLNSHTVAVDLLDRRGGNYSNRQIFIGV